MRRILVAAFVVAVGGCALFRGAARPVAYAAELESCLAEANDWASYTPCCVAVNGRYPLPDGGKRDTSTCYPPDGGTND